MKMLFFYCPIAHTNSTGHRTLATSRRYAPPAAVALARLPQNFTLDSKLPDPTADWLDAGARNPPDGGLESDLPESATNISRSKPNSPAKPSALPERIEAVLQLQE